MSFIVLDYIFTKLVQSELCFTLRKPTHATYSDFFHGCKNDNFQSNLLIIIIFAQSIDCGYTLETASFGRF